MGDQARKSGLSRSDQARRHVPARALLLGVYLRAAKRGTRPDLRAIPETARIVRPTLFYNRSWQPRPSRPVVCSSCLRDSGPRPGSPRGTCRRFLIAGLASFLLGARRTMCHYRLHARARLHSQVAPPCCQAVVWSSMRVCVTSRKRRRSVPGGGDGLVIPQDARGIRCQGLRGRQDRLRLTRARPSRRAATNRPAGS
jgi:hypothetical protein